MAIKQLANDLGIDPAVFVKQLSEESKQRLVELRNHVDASQQICINEMTSAWEESLNKKQAERVLSWLHAPLNLLEFCVFPRVKSSACIVEVVEPLADKKTPVLLKRKHSSQRPRPLALAWGSMERQKIRAFARRQELDQLQIRRRKIILNVTEESQWRKVTEEEEEALRKGQLKISSIRGLKNLGQKGGQALYWGCEITNVDPKTEQIVQKVVIRKSWIRQKKILIAEELRVIECVAAEAWKGDQEVKVVKWMGFPGFGLVSL